MSLLRKIIINISDLLGTVFPKIFLIKKKYKKSRLTIYNLHSTNENYFSNYKSILKKIDSQDKFLNPKNIDNFFKKKYSDQSYSLLTLDDGFYNNLEFAEKVLKPLKIKAIFFIIPSMLKDKQNKNIEFFEVLYPNYNKKTIPNLACQFTPLSKLKYYAYSTKALMIFVGLYLIPSKKNLVPETSRLQPSY